MMMKYQMPGMSSERGGFTLIELIITIIVLGIVMIPLAFMSLEYVQGIAFSRELVIAEGLAETEMAKINNLSYSDVALADGYDNTTLNYEGYGVDLNRKVDFVAGSSNNLKKVEVAIYESGTTAQLAKLITYVADISFGPGSGGGGVGGGEADSLVVSDGSISGTDLQNVTLQNTDPADITITGIIISFTGAGGIKLNTITMGGAEKWSGNVSSGSTITFDTNFTLTASTTYTNTGLFEFSKNLTSVTSLTFIMSDGSQTVGYSW